MLHSPTDRDPTELQQPPGLSIRACEIEQQLRLVFVAQPSNDAARGAMLPYSEWRLAYVASYPT